MGSPMPVKRIRHQYHGCLPKRLILRKSILSNWSTTSHGTIHNIQVARTRELGGEKASAQRDSARSK
jgi:hypothetical protein